MNISLGIDIVETDRFNKMSTNFSNKIFTKKEIDYCTSKPFPPQHFAARFSAKEAIIKAFYKFNKKLNLKEIEIVNNSNGRPLAYIKSLDLSNFRIEISMSHAKDIATSVAMVVKIN